MRFKAKPIRTELFVPGNKEDWMRRAPRFNADAYILDLEDSVPPRRNLRPASRWAGWCRSWARRARPSWCG